MNRAGDLFGLLLLFLLSGCRGSLSDSGGKKAVGAQIDATVVPSFLQQRVHPHSSDSSCIQRQESVDKPFWLPEQGIVITRLLSMCLAPLGIMGTGLIQPGLVCRYRVFRETAGFSGAVVADP